MLPAPVPKTMDCLFRVRSLAHGALGRYLAEFTDMIVLWTIMKNAVEIYALPSNTFDIESTSSAVEDMIRSVCFASLSNDADAVFHLRVAFSRIVEHCAAIGGIQFCKSADRFYANVKQKRCVSGWFRLKAIGGKDQIDIQFAIVGPVFLSGSVPVNAIVPRQHAQSDVLSMDQPIGKALSLGKTYRLVNIELIPYGCITVEEAEQEDPYSLVSYVIASCHVSLAHVLQ